MIYVKKPIFVLIYSLPWICLMFFNWSATRPAPRFCSFEDGEYPAQMVVLNLKTKRRDTLQQVAVHLEGCLLKGIDWPKSSPLHGIRLPELEVDDVGALDIQVPGYQVQVLIKNDAFQP